MIEAIAVQVERSGAVKAPSPLLSGNSRASAEARATDGGPLRDSARAGEADHQGRSAAHRVPPAGLIDKQGLLSAQGEVSKEDQERSKDPQNLTEEERAKVKELQARDREVRAHEQAHARVGGQYAGSPRYTFETGPDGKRYAVAGQVSIDTSPIRGNPEATIRKLDQVKKAALAPAEPSAQDRKVAAQAEAGKAEARAELARERAAEQREARESDENDPTGAAKPGASKTDDGPLAAVRERIEEARALATDPSKRPEQPGDRLTVAEARRDGSLGAADGGSFEVDRAFKAYGDRDNGQVRFEGAADASRVLNLVA